MRLDTFLTTQISESRSQIAQLIKKEAIKVNGKVVTKPGFKLQSGQTVEIVFPKVMPTKQQKVSFDVDVLYEDDDLLVLNKPSGVIVHDAPSVKEPTLVDWLKQKGITLSTISGEERHGIVHRLDKGTSGVMVVAKNNDAHRVLAKQLEDKSMGRYYVAVITPPLKEEFMMIDKPIGRNPKNRLKMACVVGAKEAKTAFLAMHSSKTQKEQLIACKLFTGRTHQIRVHLESISRKIVGDEVYGGSSKSSAEHILLHALSIYFTHPRTKKQLFFVAPLDRVFKNYIEDRFEMEKFDEKDFANSIESQFNNYL